MKPDPHVVSIDSLSVRVRELEREAWERKRAERHAGDRRRENIAFVKKLFWWAFWLGFYTWIVVELVR